VERLNPCRAARVQTAGACAPERTSRRAGIRFVEESVGRINPQGLHNKGLKVGPSGGISLFVGLYKEGDCVGVVPPLLKLLSVSNS
jgi:hypothetical protein